MSKQIPLPYLLTPQEHFFMGGSVEPGLDPYTPIGVSGVSWDPESKFTSSEIAQQRKNLGNYQAGLIGTALRLKGPAVISLSELDLDGKTLNDPKILGFWDDVKKEVIEVPDRDLTQEFIDYFKSRGMELPIPMRGENNFPPDISRV